MDPTYDNVLYTGDIANKTAMPVEFSTAAYRIFHSRLAGGYRMRAGAQFKNLFDRGDGRGTLQGGSGLEVGDVADWGCKFKTMHFQSHYFYLLFSLFTSQIHRLVQLHRG